MSKRKREYEVTGVQPVLGHHHGETFSALPSEVAFAVSIGAVREVKPKKDSK